MNGQRVNRRQFLGTTGSVLVTSWTTTQLFAADSSVRDGRPHVTTPRATSGDVASEPDWEKRLTITVGPQKADLVGTSEKVIQAAVDYLARFGGGTVHILPGIYMLRNAVYMASNIRILGSGDDSVIMKAPSVRTKLAADSDWFDQEITLAKADGFQVGDGVCLQTKNPHNGGTDVVKRTLIAQSGNRFKLDKALRKNFWLMGEANVSTLFPLFSGEEIADIVFENITLDGNKKNNDNLNGNYAGCIFLQDCNRMTARNVTARNYNGDGISWQICHDVRIENCHSHDNAGLGLHPGSGSQRPLIANNRLERNDIGIFFCWGVKYGLAENNICDANRRYGISIGHRDTDNLIRKNDVLNSGKVGVIFRKERGKAFAPHRNLLEQNRIVDSGAEDGVAVDIQGETESITIRENEIRETRKPMQRVGVRIGANTKDINLVKNKIEGFAQSVSDMHEE